MRMRCVPVCGVRCAVCSVRCAGCGARDEGCGVRDGGVCVARHPFARSQHGINREKLLLRVERRELPLRAAASARHALAKRASIAAQGLGEYRRVLPQRARARLQRELLPVPGRERVAPSHATVMKRAAACKACLRLQPRRAAMSAGDMWRLPCVGRGNSSHSDPYALSLASRGSPRAQLLGIELVSCWSSAPGW